MPFDISHQTAPYDEYSLQTDYTFATGLLAIPIAGHPGTPAKIVRVHAGAGQKVVSFKIQRTGLKPVLPDPTPQNSNEVLITGNIKTTVPSLMVDGTPVYRVEGQFIYVLKEPLSHKDALPMGKAAYDSASPGADSYAIRPADWSTGWISGSTQTPEPVHLGGNIIAKP